VTRSPHEYDARGSREGFVAEGVHVSRQPTLHGGARTRAPLLDRLENPTMKRACPLLAGLVVLGASVSLSASAQAGLPVARSSRAAKVELHHTSFGEVLSTSSGFTLYEFTRDPRARDTCVSLTGCPQAWPPLQTSGRPTPGSGVRASLLSSIRLPDGASQVTYAGHPLYRYSGDIGPGETGYVGVEAFGGLWYAINAAGHAVK